MAATLIPVDLFSAIRRISLCDYGGVGVADKLSPQPECLPEERDSRGRVADLGRRGAPTPAGKVDYRRRVGRRLFRSGHRQQFLR